MHGVVLAVRQVGDDKSSRTAQSKPEEDMRRRMLERHLRNVFFSLDGEEESGENAASFLHFPQTRTEKPFSTQLNRRILF